MKRLIQLLSLAVGILFSIPDVHAQYPYYQQALLNERVGFGQNTTGGAGGQIYWVTSLADAGSGTLREALSDHTPRWIMFAVSGNIYLSQAIWVGSNKTIDGRGASISLYNWGLDIPESRNVIIENLNFKGGSNDGIGIRDGAGDVWVDHCSFNGWADEAIGITTPTAAAYTDVTISWSKFFSSNYGILIGGFPGIPNGQNMRVTLHHNWFNGTNQRHPRIRKALVHAYNNYLYNWLYHGMASTDSGQLRVENNIFHAVRNTTAVTTAGNGEPNGFSNPNNNWRVTGSEYIQANQPNSVFWPPNYYAFTLEAPDSALRTKIQTHAGATRTLGGFANMSTRAHVQGGEGALISSMHITGSGSKKVVIRAIGPSMAPWVPGAHGNTVLRVYNSAGQQIAYNDNWGDSQWAELQASGIAPPHYLEAAVLLTLTPGTYSAVIDGWGPGIASVEVYDIDPSTATTSKLVNISSRATVDPNSPPIAGLILDSGMTKVILRGIGPSLANHGIQNPISDPTLSLHDANGTQIAYNNNWQENPDVGPTGWAPPDWREAAIVINLGTGNYTAILRDYLGAWGIGSLQVYKL